MRSVGHMMTEVLNHNILEGPTNVNSRVRDQKDDPARVWSHYILIQAGRNVT